MSSQVAAVSSRLPLLNLSCDSQESSVSNIIVVGLITCRSWLQNDHWPSSPRPLKLSSGRTHRNARAHIGKPCVLKDRSTVPGAAPHAPICLLHAIKQTTSRSQARRYSRKGAA